MSRADTAGDADDRGIQAVADRAVELVRSGDKVGLGTGRAASAFIARLGARVQQGLAVTGVPTSEVSARQAETLGIPLVGLEEGVELDLTVDGADEVTPGLDLVKGRGGAMVRERIVAAASMRQVILIGSEKLVQALGERGGIPIEIIPMALALITHRLKALGVRPTLRRGRAEGGVALVSENGNLTLDAVLDVPLPDRRAASLFDAEVRGIPGVVDTGLFLGMAERVLVGHPDGRVDVLLATKR
jgi:ribose 5-phosphate isomerase A